MLSFSGLGGLRASSLEASGLHDTKLKLVEIANKVLREPLINDVTSILDFLRYGTVQYGTVRYGTLLRSLI